MYKVSFLNFKFSYHYYFQIIQIFLLGGWSLTKKLYPNRVLNVKFKSENIKKVNNVKVQLTKWLLYRQIKIRRRVAVSGNLQMVNCKPSRLPPKS